MSSGSLSRSRWLGILAALWLVGTCAPARAGGIAPDLRDQILKNPLSITPQRVIVQFSRGGVNASLLALLYGGQKVRDLLPVQGALFTVPTAALELLAQDVSVAWVSPDRPVARQGDYDVQTAGADAAWNTYGVRGNGVRVAVLDTGVRSDTQEWSTNGNSRIVAWRDLVNNQATPYDDNGHGTHVAGIVLGAGSASAGQVTGTAPNADLVAVKVLGQDGSGLTSTVIAGIDWCILNKSTYNIRVLNLSLGQKPAESTTTDPLCAAVRRAVDAGIVVVCSAGNKGKNAQNVTVWGGISCPGNEPAAITVGALNTRETANRGDDSVCSYSSRGPTYIDHWAKPDLLAPGNRIVSVRDPGAWIDSQHPENRIDTDPYTPATVDYYQLSGTSMAAPQVAGTAALILQRNPNLGPATVKGVLTYTAEHIATGFTTGLDNLTQGAGALNALGAVELAGILNTGASQGSYWLTSALSGQSTIGGRSFSWVGRLLWGDLAYSGTDLMTYRQQAWMDLLRWGSAVTWTAGVSSTSNGVAASQAQWSNQAAWNDPGIWGDQLTWGGDDETTLVGDPPGTPGGMD